MNDLSKINDRIDQYLDAVRAQLSGLSGAEADSIIADLREHIDAAMQARGDGPSLDSVEAVLAKMDPPASFASELDGTTSAAPKVSRLALIGAVLLPFGILVTILLLFPAIVVTSTSGNPSGTTWWQWLLRFTVLPLGIISPFATTILGLVSISQIRASKGKLIGKPLALLDALFYPLLVLDGLLLAPLIALSANLPHGAAALTWLGILLLSIVDLVIVILSWRKIR